MSDIASIIFLKITKSWAKRAFSDSAASALGFSAQQKYGFFWSGKESFHLFTLVTFLASHWENC
jgi:hypothetical protein